MPKIPTRDSFPKKLREAMAAKQMTPSDLARAIWGTVADPRGYKVARNRDRIGVYLAGTGYPSKETLPKLCEALGWSMDEVPASNSGKEPRALAGGSDFSFSLLADQPSLCLIYIRKNLPTEVGMKILRLITDDEQSRSREAR